MGRTWWLGWFAKKRSWSSVRASHLVFCVPERLSLVFDSLERGMKQQYYDPFLLAPFWATGCFVFALWVVLLDPRLLV